MKINLSWKVLAVANLFLGLFLWFLFSTDYSLIGTIPDILFPPLVGIVALVSVGIIKTSKKWQGLLIKLAHLPSAIGGGLYILTALVMLIPPFTLGAMFAVSEIADERQIQRATSPDGTQIAYVYFRGVGAYSGGNGRIFVRVRRSALSFLERDIFYLRVSNASEDSTNYLEWHGNDTIYIPEINDEISVGVIEVEIPQVVALPYGIIRRLFAMAEQAKINQQQTIPVRDVPIYPGDIFSNQSQFLEEENTVFRSFNVEREDIETVEKWYEEILAKPPWSLVQVNRYTESEASSTHIRYCIQATRDVDNEQRIYYWEFMGSNDLSRGVHINIGTPSPITDTCKRYADKP
jgi:hypothetical protein